MKSLIVFGITAANFAMIIVGLYGGGSIKKFLAKVSAIKDEQDMMLFKKMAAEQMYLTLFLMPVCVMSLLVYLFFLFTGFFTGSEKLFFLVQYVAIFYFSKKMKQDETKSRTLEVSSDTLRQERDHIVATWEKKPFPDW